MNSILRHCENGLISLMYQCFDDAAMVSSRASKTTVFETLDAYIEEYSGEFV